MSRRGEGVLVLPDRDRRGEISTKLCGLAKKKREKIAQPVFLSSLACFSFFTFRVRRLRGAEP